MQFSKDLFKGYDIRGVYPSQLSDGLCVGIGKALGTLASMEKLSNVVISSDGAKNSLVVFKKLMEGLVSTPITVTDVGVCLPQAVHFALANKKFDLSIYVSHSHSVDNQVVFRTTRAPSIPLSRKDYEFIKDLLISEKFVLGSAKSKQENVLNAYVDYLKPMFEHLKDLKVMLGLGDNVTRDLFPKVFDKIGIPLIIQDTSHDVNLVEFSKLVKNSEPALAVHIDYGLEQFNVFDEYGSIYENDKILMILVESVLSKNPGKKIVFDVKSTELLKEFIKSRGGLSGRIKTGYPSFISHMIGDTVLGGEFSGNIYFKDNYFGYDDHIFTVLRILERIFETKRPLSYIMQTYPMRVHSPEIKLPCPNDFKYGLMDTLLDNFKEILDVRQIENTDGVRVHITPTGWFLIRASNTGPYLSVRVEGLYEKEARMVLERVKTVLTPFVFVDIKQLESVKLHVS
uniref:Phosphomannomutase n=1 Tax=candidate division WWE3 bacterium TaxID=2053526 RepID=A0A7C4TLU1_UNCKA